MVALTGLWMTLFYPWATSNNDGVAVYVPRLIFGTAMVVSIGMGIDAIRRPNFNAHVEWMIWGYAIGIGAGTQVLTHLPWFILVGKPDELGRAVMMGAGWVINVVVAEWIIRSARARREQSAARADSIRTEAREARRELTHAS